MKAQSFIVEFILFFAIAFGLFSTISYFFYSQNTFFSERIGEAASELMNNIISSGAMKGITCKGCDSILIKNDVLTKIGNHYYKIELSNNGGQKTILLSENPYSKQGVIFNLNKTFDLFGESSSENKKIEIKINNTGKTIEVK